jgi:hypothetical protein
VALTRKTRRTIEQIDRDAKAVDLRRRHLTFRQIADQLGYASVASAYDAVHRGLLDAMREPADAVRNMELQRLDELGRAAWRVLYDKHYVVGSAGKVALHPDTGRPLVDDGPVLAAMDRLLKISEARRKLLGLDAPVRAEVRHVDSFDADIAALVAGLAAGGKGPAAGHPEVLDVADPGAS